MQYWSWIVERSNDWPIKPYWSFVEWSVYWQHNNPLNKIRRGIIQFTRLQIILNWNWTASKYTSSLVFGEFVPKRNLKVNWSFYAKQFVIISLSVWYYLFEPFQVGCASLIRSRSSLNWCLCAHFGQMSNSFLIWMSVAARF